MHIDGCDPEEFAHAMWPEAAPGLTVSVTCPCIEAEGPTPERMTRKCDGNYSHGARWGDVNDSQCAVGLTRELCAMVSFTKT